MTSKDWARIAEIAEQSLLRKPGSTVRYINGDTFIEKLREEAAKVKKKEEETVIGDPLKFGMNTKVPVL